MPITGPRCSPPGTWRVYNLGNGEGFSVREVIAAARRVTGLHLTEQSRPGERTTRRCSSPRPNVLGRARMGPEQTEARRNGPDAWQFLQRRHEISYLNPPTTVRRRLRPQPGGNLVGSGRVNLIGEFTDYNDGFGLPFALPFAARAYPARRDHDLVRVASAQRSESGGLAVVEVAPDNLKPGTTRGGRVRPRRRLGAATSRSGLTGVELSSTERADRCRPLVIGGAGVFGCLGPPRPLRTASFPTGPGTCRSAGRERIRRRAYRHHGPTASLLCRSVMACSSTRHFEARQVPST